MSPNLIVKQSDVFNKADSELYATAGNTNGIALNSLSSSNNMTVTRKRSWSDAYAWAIKMMAVIELKTLNVLRQSLGTVWKMNKSKNVRAYFQV